jgi:hypothetical protein
MNDYLDNNPLLEPMRRNSTLPRRRYSFVRNPPLEKLSGDDYVALFDIVDNGDGTIGEYVLAIGAKYASAVAICEALNARDNAESAMT